MLECGRNTEKIENVSGPHLKKCPHCGGKVESVITAPSIQFQRRGLVRDGLWWKKVRWRRRQSRPSPPRKQKKQGTREDSASTESTSKEAASKDAKEGKEKKSAKKK